MNNENNVLNKLKKVSLHFDDPEKQLAFELYKNYDLDGCRGFVRKGIDGFITVTVVSQKEYGIPYTILALDDAEDNLIEVGARLAAGSPRVYVEYKNGNEYEVIRVSIDPYNPRILDGDERDCHGADFAKIFDFIRKCYQSIIDHWNGKINNFQLWNGVHMAMKGEIRFTDIEML